MWSSPTSSRFSLTSSPLSQRNRDRDNVECAPPLEAWSPRLAMPRWRLPAPHSWPRCSEQTPIVDPTQHEAHSAPRDLDREVEHPSDDVVDTLAHARHAPL